MAQGVLYTRHHVNVGSSHSVHGRPVDSVHVALSTRIEGWFSDNESPEPVAVKLVTAGFYDYILQKDDVKTRLQPIDPK
jgi:hypothetical protein